MTISQISTLLDKHYHQIEAIILSRQDPITGLLPASTAINPHGNYTDAWVRDNVYSILAVWGLALAYKKYQPDHARTYTLSHSVVKLMRGLLISMMRQSAKVEKFKYTLNPIDALHAKYGTKTGLPVVKDGEWGHLQLDATSIFLLQLAQMSASGLQIIYTSDEVNFVQNLVHYISRTYCTPDYGIWERGNKINHGTAEVNCSSVGMAKAALEALNGFNLYGNSSGNEGVIHVVVNDIARSRFTLHEMLPKESNSKEIDAALLSIIGYPAYAVEDEEIVQKTLTQIIDKLAGRYGCKRFLLDGHQSSIEDVSKLYYESFELKAFEHIESEWPLFFTYLLLDAKMRNDTKSATYWREKLEPLFVEQNGVKLLPELYIVPKESIKAEKQNPHSQTRIANENLPLVWAQSLWILSALMEDGLLLPSDIDPLKRRERIALKRTNLPLVAIVAQTDKVKKILYDHGIKSETLKDIYPLHIMYSDELSKLYGILGKNDKLKLSGRPPLEVRTISTSFLYRIAGAESIFLPYYFNPKGFYLSYDNRLLTKHFKSSLKFLSEHWNQAGQPLITFFVREDMLIEKDKETIITLLDQIQKGECDIIKIKSGPISILQHATAKERIDYIHDLKLQTVEEASNERTFFESVETMGYKLDSNKITILENSTTEALCVIVSQHENHLKRAVALKILHDRVGAEYQILFGDTALCLSEIARILYKLAMLRHDWSVVRRLAELIDAYDDRLEDVLLEIVVRQKQLAVGRSFYEDAILSKPYESFIVMQKIKSYCGGNTAETILTQEILLHLGHIIRAEPELFETILTFRVWFYIQLIVGQISAEKSLSIAEAYEYLIGLSPYEIYTILHTILHSFVAKVEQLSRVESIHAQGMEHFRHLSSDALHFYENTQSDWMEWRKEVGMIGHIDAKTLSDVWSLLQRSQGVVIGDKYNIHNRIGLEDIFESTAHERRFKLLFDAKLQRIPAPEYRQLNIELIKTLAAFFEENQEIVIKSDLVFDVIIGHAVQLEWCKSHDEAHYEEQKAKAWEVFYRFDPKIVSDAYIEAFVYLVK